MVASRFMRKATIGLAAAVVLLAVSVATARTPIAVTLWDQFDYAGLTAAGPAADELIAKFESAHPDIKILRTVAPSIGIRETYRLSMVAGRPPDLAYTWPAAAVLASYAKDGKLADLTPYIGTFGWQWLDRFYVGRNSYRGKLYGMPMEQDLMGVYYNKDLFKELNLKVPATYAEFLQIADAIKKAGYIPIAFGNRDRWPATNTFSLILGLTTGRAKEEEVLFGDAKWTRPEFVRAAETLLDWVKRGYFPDGFNGIGYDEANALFFSGRAAMNITGTWVVQDIAREAKFDVGVFMLPPVSQGVAPGTMWGEGSQWQISAVAPKEVRDAAAQFVAFMVAAENRKVWVEKGYLVPIGTTAEELLRWNTPQLVKDFYREGLKTASANFYDLHTTLPESVTQVLYAKLQEMLGNRITALEFLQTMQEAWEQAIAKGERWVP